MSAYSLVDVGVRYCVTHDGIANEDDDVCDFSRHEVIDRRCVFRALYRKVRRKSP